MHSASQIPDVDNEGQDTVLWKWITGDKIGKQNGECVRCRWVGEVGSQTSPDAVSVSRCLWILSNSHSPCVPVTVELHLSFDPCALNCCCLLGLFPDGGSSREAATSQGRSGAHRQTSHLHSWGPAFVRAFFSSVCIGHFHQHWLRRSCVSGTVQVLGA